MEHVAVPAQLAGALLGREVRRRRSTASGWRSDRRCVALPPAAGPCAHDRGHLAAALHAGGHGGRLLQQRVLLRRGERHPGLGCAPRSAIMSKAPSELRNLRCVSADSTASSVSRNGATFASVDPGTMASESTSSVFNWCASRNSGLYAALAAFFCAVAAGGRADVLMDWMLLRARQARYREAGADTRRRSSGASRGVRDPRSSSRPTGVTGIDVGVLSCPYRRSVTRSGLTAESETNTNTTASALYLSTALDDPHVAIDRDVSNRSTRPLGCGHFTSIQSTLVAVPRPSTSRGSCVER